MNALALCGGIAVRTTPFPPTNTIGVEERDAVTRVMHTGVLSQFLGSAGEEFLGGKEVRSCEQAYARRLRVAHALTVNSATTGLEVALGAAGIQPGDEVIVSPFTMSATAATILLRNAVPVFADIENETFGLDPAAVEQLVTPRTRAIVVVHLFGHPARMGSLLETARRHDLAVVEDAAQSIGATWRGNESGTLGDVGVLSLNRHKIIQCGEGGIVVTQDDAIARIVALQRNHGEVVADQLGESAVGSLGTNYRMTELQAAIAESQLSKLGSELAIRRRLASSLTARLTDRLELVTPVIAEDCTHSWYLYPLRYLAEQADGVPRAAIAAALRAEGVPVNEGYVRPLYLQEIYQQREGRGRGCPWSCGHWHGEVSYAAGICPTTERLHYEEMLLLDVVRSPLTERDIDDVATALHKVLDNREALRNVAISA